MKELRWYLFAGFLAVLLIYGPGAAFWLFLIYIAYLIGQPPVAVLMSGPEDNS